MESQHEKKTKFPLQKQGWQWKKEKPIHDEVFSEKYLDISGAFWRRKMPFLEEQQQQPEKGRSGHIWIRVLQGIIFVFIANLGQISRLQMLLLRSRGGTVSKNDHHDDNDTQDENSIDFPFFTLRLGSVFPWLLIVSVIRRKLQICVKEDAIWISSLICRASSRIHYDHPGRAAGRQATTRKPSSIRASCLVSLFFLTDKCWSYWCGG